MTKQYLCIDLKSFYASVECVKRGLDPLRTNLVVADSSRTEKTICLAVTPGLKSFGISGRARLFEVVQKVRNINSLRRQKSPGRCLKGETYDLDELQKNPSLALGYIVATPHMAQYIEYSTRIYDIYLKFISPEDIHVYSIDEVFMDITGYLNSYDMTPREFAGKIVKEVLDSTGITATVGIGTNMYLAKVAMDIVAKKIPPDKNGVRIAELDEMSYRRKLWNHKPLTDFWRIGKGYAKKLEANYMYTMGDVAKVSLTKQGEDTLYKLFGVNAELLIDHAWGWEPCTMDAVKSYKPESKSLGAGQVLHCAYDFDGGRLIVREMAEVLALDLLEKELVTDQIVLTVGYDIENLSDLSIRNKYKGEVTEDFYGRKVPKHAHGTTNIGRYTSSAKVITKAATELFGRIADADLLVRRVNICANHVIPEMEVKDKVNYEQMELFTDYSQKDINDEKESKALDKERKIQEATLDLRKRFGKNVILKGFNLKEGATTIDRNNQIGGHKK